MAMPVQPLLKAAMPWGLRPGLRVHLRKKTPLDPHQCNRSGMAFHTRITRSMITFRIKTHHGRSPPLTGSWRPQGCRDSNLGWTPSVCAASSPERQVLIHEAWESSSPLPLSMPTPPNTLPEALTAQALIAANRIVKERPVPRLRPLPLQIKNQNQKTQTSKIHRSPLVHERGLEPPRLFTAST